LGCGHLLEQRLLLIVGFVHVSSSLLEARRCAGPTSASPDEAGRDKTSTAWWITKVQWIDTNQQLADPMCRESFVAELGAVMEDVGGYSPVPLGRHQPLPSEDQPV
jgi:hypothetical protein